jgi:hypothetical protein
LINSAEAFANRAKGNVDGSELSLRVVGSGSRLAVGFVAYNYSDYSPALYSWGSRIALNRMQTAKALYHVFAELAAELASSPALILRTKTGDAHLSSKLFRFGELQSWDRLTIRNLKRGNVG